MKHTKHGSYMHELTKFGAFNNFLVEEDDGLTLIDTNLGDNTAAIVEIAQQIGKPITRLIVTHAHADHAGAVDALLGSVSNVKFIASEREARLLRGDKTLDENEPDSPLGGSYVTVAAEPTKTVTDGDTIGSLQVIHAPGHTPGHIALLDTREGTLIAGDAFISKAGLAVSGVFRLFFPFPSLATWDKPTALATAQHLLKQKPALLAVGHGPVIPEPNEAMERAIAEAAQKFS